ncbi:MAG: RNA polymerase subunit sigma-70 [Planctomycetaceae bacterium]|nr:RNA polymerase subunit sigma-70 [Planctomycetaceae bacterium]
MLNRCLAEEPGAWKDFVDRFIGLFVHVINHTAHARSVRLTQEDVDDLCAEVFVGLLANDYATLRAFRGKSSLATYLTVVSRRIIVREISRRRMAEAFGHVNAHKSSIDQAHAAALEPAQFEDQEELQILLKELDPKEADIVRQFHIEGRTYREISDSTGVPENSIGPTLNRAREKMRTKKVESTR